LKDRAEYLLHRRFPYARAIGFPTSLTSRHSRGAGPTPEIRQRVEAYRAELAALSVEELVARYNAEKQREYDAAIVKAEQEERERFFNTPYAKADYDHWSRRRIGRLMKRSRCLSGERLKLCGGINCKNSARWGRRSWRNTRVAATSPCAPSIGSSFSIPCYRAFSWLGRSEPILPFRLT
jgi:hypothetical protein